MNPFVERLPSAPPFGILAGHGQAPLRHALRISLGRALAERSMLANCAAWGLGVGLLNALMSPPNARWANFLGAIVSALCVGYLGAIPWRWRIVRGGHRSRLMVNGIAALVLGYGCFFASYWLVALVLIPAYAIEPWFIAIMLKVAVWGFVLAVIGYYITTGQDAARRQRWMARAKLRQERLTSEARQAALRAQINPHFFFNALNTIAALIPANPAAAERATELLATALRPVLTREQAPTAALDSELAVARAYAEIETLRFGERLTVEFDIDPAALALRLPSLCLQPLVENAVRHGVARVPGGHRIRVKAQPTPGALTLTVCNEPTDQAVDQPSEVAPFIPGHALHNVQQRLATLFPGGSAIRVLVNRAGSSAVATLHVFQHREEHRS